MTEHRWKPGQEVILGGAVVTIDRVTATGIAVIGDRKFNQDGGLRGWERTSFLDRRPWITEATPRLRAEIARNAAAEAAEDEFYAAQKRMEGWLRGAKPRGRLAFDAIPTAHALTDAINAVLDNAEKETSE